MNATVDKFLTLPMPLQQAIAKDWIDRHQNNEMRGLGVAQHYDFLLWVSAEYEISLQDLLSEGR